MNRQKHKLSRRILAMLLTAAMLVTMFPAAMFATPTAEVGSEGVPKLDVSKSKTATNLQQNADGNWQSNVTLSLPSEEYSQTMDVVFVIDDSSAGSGIFAGPAMDLLDTLRATENLNVNVGIVTFDALARDWVDVTSDGVYKNLVSVKSEEGYSALSEAIHTELSDAEDVIGRERKIGGSNTEWAIDKATEMLKAGSGEEKYMIIFSDMYGYVYRGTLTVDGQKYENVPLSKRISGLSSASLADPEPKYDNWEEVKNHRNDNNSDYDSYFRYWSGPKETRNTKPWTDYWTIYQGLEVAPDVDEAFKEAEYAAFPWSTPGHYTPFEQSSVLTYDNILEAVGSNINVTVVNNNFDPGDPGGPRIKDIKNEMLEDLAQSHDVQLIREDAGHGTNFSSDQLAEIFANLSNELIQVVGAGSEVVDIIGDDFDFVNSADNPPTLTVDGEPLVATQLTEDSAKGATLAWSFGNETDVKRFELYYYQGGTIYDGDAVGECFIWKTNEDITKDATVQLTYTVQLTEPSTDPGTYGEYDKNGDGSLNDVDGNETSAPATPNAGLFTNERATIYPVDSNNNPGTQKDFLRPTVSYTVKEPVPEGTIAIQPADITIYTGGSSYESVVNGSGHEIGETNNGLPTPGFYITLPPELNRWMINNADLDDVTTVTVENEGGTTAEQQVVDLSGYLTFTYNDNAGNTRVWELERYDNQTGNDSMAYSKYIYRIKPAIVNSEEIPIRLQFTNGSEFMTTDDFTVNLDGLYRTYDMTIYSGDLDQDLVKAVLTVDGKENTFDAQVNSGQLTIRGVTDQNTTTTDVVTETPSSTVDNITAQVTEDTNFYINTSELEVASENNVALLVDSIVPDTNNTLYNTAVNYFDEITRYHAVQTNYLDLVDTSNGNAWVTSDKEITVHWPVPEDATDESEFYIVHYTGLDRNDNNALDNYSPEDMELYSTDNGGLTVENGNITFTVGSFSPFALFYTADDNPPYIPPSTGDDDDDPDTPALDKVNHFLYIEGYPEDYRTGEYSDNEDLWPVKPQGNITRAEVATIFYRLLKDEVREEIETDVNSFPDVNADDWFNVTVSSLANMNVISGYEDGTFRPNEPITRAELAAMAGRFYEAFDAEYEEGTFLDVEGDEWFADAIAAAAELGILGGYPDGTVRPNNNITRAETCAIVNRVLERRPHDEHLGDVDDMRTWPDNLPGAWYYADMQEATNGHYYKWIDIDGVDFEEWTEVDKDYDWTKR